jgi:hypothetical protein
MLRLVSVQPKVAVEHALFHCPLSYHTKSARHAESPDWGTLVMCHQRTLNTVGTVFDTLTAKCQLTIIDDRKITTQQGVSNIGVIIRQQSMANKLSPNLWCTCQRLTSRTSLTTPWRRCEHSLS